MSTQLRSGLSPKTGQDFSYGPTTSSVFTGDLVDMSDSLSVIISATLELPATLVSSPQASVELLWYADPGGNRLVWIDAIPSIDGWEAASASDTVFIQGPVRAPFLRLRVSCPILSAGTAQFACLVFGSNLPMASMIWSYESAGANVRGPGRLIVASAADVAGRIFWRASGSPAVTGGAAEAVVTTTWSDGYIVAPASALSYSPLQGGALHIQSLAMHVRPVAAGQAVIRLRMRKGASTAGDEIWTYALQCGVQSTTPGPTQGFSFPDGGWVIPGGQQFCWTVVAGATGATLDFIATGYTQLETG